MSTPMNIATPGCVYLLDARTVTPHFPGIGRYVASLAPALAAQLAPHERLLLLHAPEASARLAPLAGPQVTLHATAISPFSLGQQVSIPRLLRKLEPGLAPQLYHSTYLLMPYTVRLPTVLTFYDLIPLAHPETVSWRARTLFRLTMGMALQSATAVVSISEAARQDVLAHFKLPPDRVTTTPLAPDPRFRPQPPDEVARVRAQYALPEQFLLFVGINKPHKNLVRLVEAFAALAPAHPDLGLVLAGPWDDRYPEAKQAAALLAAPPIQPSREDAPSGSARLSGEDASSGSARPVPTDRIRWLGPVPDADLAALYAAATAFVFPSLYEGFGLPVLEAMACGTPVACSNTSSLPELVGDAAVLFDPLDVGALVAAIEQVLVAEGRAERAALGLARAGQFTWDRTAALTLGVYRKAVK